MQIVPATQTPLTAESSAEWLNQSIALDREQGPLIAALIWVESGAGNLTQHNPGNVTASERWEGKAWRPPWYEPPADNATQKIKDLHLKMLRGEAPKAFRAFDDFAQGYADFARVLQTNFPAVLTAASSGDVPTFVTELSRKYSKDYGPRHYPAFANWQGKMRHLFQHLPEPQQSNVAAPILLFLIMRFLTA
jgi:hypothetical protein